MRFFVDNDDVCSTGVDTLLVYPVWCADDDAPLDGEQASKEIRAVLWVGGKRYGGSFSKQDEERGLQMAEIAGHLLQNCVYISPV